MFGNEIAVTNCESGNACKINRFPRAASCSNNSSGSDARNRKSNQKGGPIPIRPWNIFGCIPERHWKASPHRAAGSIAGSGVAGIRVDGDPRTLIARARKTELRLDAEAAANGLLTGKCPRSPNAAKRPCNTSTILPPAPASSRKRRRLPPSGTRRRRRPRSLRRPASHSRVPRRRVRRRQPHDRRDRRRRDKPRHDRRRRDKPPPR